MNEELKDLNRAVLETANALFDRWGEKLSPQYGGFIQRHKNSIEFSYAQIEPTQCLSGWLDSFGWHKHPASLENPNTLDQYLKAEAILNSIAIRYTTGDFLQKRDDSIRRLKELARIMR